MPPVRGAPGAKTRGQRPGPLRDPHPSVPTVKVERLAGCWKRKGDAARESKGRKTLPPVPVAGFLEPACAGGAWFREIRLPGEPGMLTFPRDCSPDQEARLEEKSAFEHRRSVSRFGCRGNRPDRAALPALNSASRLLNPGHGGGIERAAQPDQKALDAFPILLAQGLARVDQFVRQIEGRQ